MNLFPELKKRYSGDNLNAREAQRLAEFIAFGPVVFQTARILLKWGILDIIRDSDNGMTIDEVAKHTNISIYAAKCLMEAALCIGILFIDPETDRFRISKTGWFLINDPAVRVNIDFNHDVNYEGWFHLEESLKERKPAGLKHFGDWPTVYEGLSSLPEQVQKSWFGFDHFYSDSSFPEALEIVFKKNMTRSLYDVGGNTGKWALQCVSFDKDVEVTILDLPQQIKLMEANVLGKDGADRIKGHEINLLDASAKFPKNETAPDAIWMSQFLDCFSMEEIVSILSRAKEAMGDNTRIYIMETLWDRQRFEPAAFCLTMTSLYFTAIANGNSKMYNTEDLAECIKKAGLEIEKIYDGLGQGHSIIKVKLINQ
ncbi:SAM-dependent methyltransferase [Muribaculaceae bacterium Isolate-042 (Harlan)]|uniref:methyltransferase n=1 Tax=Duncaniella muris TaxID=2094150 RepID=UPI000F475BE2|nr:SAM-dependent methyltransferase [Muribaculaceae bacterium Isolate-042 (Harlan)]